MKIRGYGSYYAQIKKEASLFSAPKQHKSVCDMLLLSFYPKLHLSQDAEKPTTSQGCVNMLFVCVVDFVVWIIPIATRSSGARG